MAVASVPTSEIPDYLETYVVKQDPSLYTPIDHATWRYILRISRPFFAKHAHEKYLAGLKETGISTERIPLIDEMDACLRKFGWRTVAVSGFIPPAVFMEFLARGILPIACDMRKIENLAYTPAPDIVHEAAGHAPIIADPEYAAYLRHYGELAEKAICSAQDLEVYHAVRVLSETKEDPGATPEVVALAQASLDRAVAAVDHITEATQLGRMGWWTIEYGLIGDARDPKIYGAGLLSSVGESYHCLGPDVKKIPFTKECVDISYDITRPQPQLFLAPDFQSLTRGIDEFGATMAFRKGGAEGLEKAWRAAVPTTVVLDSGIQISGTLSKYTIGPDQEPTYLKFDGPTQLSFDGQELEGQDPHHHPQGFSTVIGRIKGRRGQSPAELSEQDLATLGFRGSKRGQIQFESGALLEGMLTGSIRRANQNVVLTFTDCRIQNGAETLFDPAWGVFDLACGSRVVSVFGGAADRRRYLSATGGFHQTPGKPKSNLTEKNRALNLLYGKVRLIREQSFPAKDPGVSRELARIHEELESSYPSDWLLRFELLELDSMGRFNGPWVKTARGRLEQLAKADEKISVGGDKNDRSAADSTAELIARGLALL